MGLAFRPDGLVGAILVMTSATASRKRASQVQPFRAQSRPSFPVELGEGTVSPFSACTVLRVELHPE